MRIFVHVARHGMRIHMMPRFAASFLNGDRCHNLFDSAEVEISVITAAIIIILVNKKIKQIRKGI